VVPIQGEEASRGDLGLRRRSLRERVPLHSTDSRKETNYIGREFSRGRKHDRGLRGRREKWRSPSKLPVGGGGTKKSSQKIKKVLGERSPGEAKDFHMSHSNKEPDDEN